MEGFWNKEELDGEVWIERELDGADGESSVRGEEHKSVGAIGLVIELDDIGSVGVIMIGHGPNIPALSGGETEMEF